MKDKKSLVMVIIIGITISVFLCFNTTVFATTGTVSTSDLRLRKEDNTSSEVIMLLNENDKVEILSENGDWYKVNVDGKIGYVSKQYIKVEDNNIIPNETSNTSENNTTSETQQNTVQSNENSVSTTPEENTQSAQTENENTTAQNKIKEATINSESQIKIMPLINADVINTAKSAEKYMVTSNVGLWSYITNNEKSGWVLTQNLTIQEVSNQTSNNNNNEQNSSEENNETTTKEPVSENNNEEDEEQEQQKTSKTYYVNGTTVNARSSASTSSKVLKQLDINEKVTVTGEEGEWYIIDLDGKTAYVSKPLLSSKKVDVTSRSTTTVQQTTEETNKTTTQQEEVQNQAPATTSSSSSGEAVVAYAKQFLGYKYVYGTNGPNTFDCSGFVQYVYKHFGISLSRSSKTQANDGVAVSKSDLQPGDILIFKNTSRTAIGHVGIYIGNNQFIHASSSKTGVIISSLSSSSYQQRYVSARRVL